MVHVPVQQAAESLVVIVLVEHVSSCAHACPLISLQVFNTQLPFSHVLFAAQVIPAQASVLTQFPFEHCSPLEQVIPAHGSIVGHIPRQHWLESRVVTVLSEQLVPE